MAVWLVAASLIVTFRPCALNRPLCWAMNRPAESIAGNASMTMFGFSSGPPLVLPDTPPPDVPEHPASSAMAAAAATEVRLAIRDFIHTPDRTAGVRRL